MGVIIRMVWIRGIRGKVLWEKLVFITIMIIIFSYKPSWRRWCSAAQTYKRLIFLRRSVQCSDGSLPLGGRTCPASERARPFNVNVPNTSPSHINVGLISDASSRAEGHNCPCTFCISNTGCMDQKLVRWPRYLPGFYGHGRYISELTRNNQRILS
jgi:hypothetical protein